MPLREWRVLEADNNGKRTCCIANLELYSTGYGLRLLSPISLRERPALRNVEGAWREGFQKRANRDRLQ